MDNALKYGERIRLPSSAGEDESEMPDHPQQRVFETLSVARIVPSAVDWAMQPC
jgi:hypothetical protein